jgi:hypothetical protein
MTDIVERLRGKAGLIRMMDQHTRSVSSVPELLERSADRIDELTAALKGLTVMARTSGGTAGRDDALCAACDEAEAALGEGK